MAQALTGAVANYFRHARGNVAVEQVLEELGGFHKGALLFAAEAHISPSSVQ